MEIEKIKRIFPSSLNDYLNEITAAACLGGDNKADSCLVSASSQITANFLVLLKTPGSEAAGSSPSSAPLRARAGTD